MKSLLKLFLTSQLKCYRRIEPVSGFTLIELLVAMILAVLVITPLLGFMINVLDNDRKEQAKAASEQEIQTALDYIARDLKQAVYIYEADGLTKKSNTDPTLSGIQDQIAPGSGDISSCKSGNFCEPVLVFWKRKYLQGAVPVASSGADDTFVYSLVAYYLIRDNSSTWSKAARIARFEIRDGIQDVSGISCGADYPDEKYLKDWCPDEGFKRFDLTESGSDLKEKMNRWKKASKAYEQNPLVLVDYIDQTTTANKEAPPAVCPPDNNSDPKNKIVWSKVTPKNLTSFYVCVDTLNTTAQVFLRGNALARLQEDKIDFSNDKKTYFPTASIQIEGRGYLYNQ